MKFLIHIPQLIYGGAEKVLVTFANCLVVHGHEVEILETYEKGFLKPHFDSRVTFHAICNDEYTKKHYSSLKDIKNERNLLKKIVKCTKLIFSKIVGYRKFAEKLASKYYKDRHYDVAINYLEIESPAFIMNNINADKYFQWIHIDVEKLKPGELDEFATLYEKMDAVLCVAETVKSALCKKYPSLSEKSYVIYNFFDIQNIINKSNADLVFNNDEFNILSVGRMVSQKGYIRALSIMHELKLQGYSFVWNIIGDGIEKEQIEKKISELNLTDEVKLFGLKDNPYPYIKQCDLFFLPSVYEGFPTVTIEAKVLGKPVLSTEVSGIREQIENGRTGLIVENSEKGIYEGLKRILDNPDFLKKLSDNSGMEQVLDNEEKYNIFIKILDRTL